MPYQHVQRQIPVHPADDPVVEILQDVDEVSLSPGPVAKEDWISVPRFVAYGRSEVIDYYTWINCWKVLYALIYRENCNCLAVDQGLKGYVDPTFLWGKAGFDWYGTVNSKMDKLSVFITYG